METCKSFFKPVIDLQATGETIRKLRIINRYSVKELQQVFGFEYPQAIYAWEQGKNIPSIDNLMVLSQLFHVSVEDLIKVNYVEIQLECSEQITSCMNQTQENCEICRFKRTA